MPFSRDPRKDRRRRVLREAVPNDDTGATQPTRARVRRNGNTDADDVLDNQPRRSAGYSQDVRRTCQHRLVQLIPVRRRAFLATIFVSCLIPLLLLIAHYLVYVSGTLRLYGNPLAVMLDAGHSRGLCAWLCSQLWLLCLGATIFTFRLRRHKLDDYQGEYRLWFWLVSTCIVGSLDSTTGVIEIFGQAMDRWSQLNLGWSGKAVVQATLATLIGILGIRLCSELKNVPTSLVFWLVGLLAWAGSAVLSQELFKIDLSSQFRYWLRSALWIGGMTSIWLAALAYLRNVYIDAQRRFLLRGHLAASVSSTWRERVASTMPAMPALPSLPKISLRRGEAEGAPNQKQARQLDEVTEPRRRFALPSLLRRKTAQGTPGLTASDEKSAKQRIAPEQSLREQPTTAPQRHSDTGPAPTAKLAPTPSTTPRSTSGPGSASSSKATADSDATGTVRPKRSLLSRLMRSPKNSDEAPEYAKVDRSGTAPNDEQPNASAPKSTNSQKPAVAEDQRKSAKSQAEKSAANDGEPAKKKGWFRLPKISLPRPKLPRIPRPRLPKIGIPKLKLPSLRLPPPDSSDKNNQDVGTSSDIKPINANRPLPSTSSASVSSSESAARPLSKAERKRMKKIQDDQESQRRAA